MSIQPSNAPSSLAAIPPPVTADRETLTNSRVRTAADVVGAFSVMWTADLERSRQRALCQSAVDGAPPYSDAKSRSLGTFGRSNFNPGLARRSTFREESPYNELLEQMDILCTFPTKHGDQNQQVEWAPILAECFTEMMIRWPAFNYLWQYGVSLFVRDGVSIACFEDENDWRYWFYGMQHFKFPNESKPCEDMLDMCGWKVKMNCSQLFRMVKNEAIAGQIGWNVPAVKEAIKQASAINDTSFDAERWEARWKNNEVMDGSRAPQVEVIHLLVKELDGTVTHLICQKSPAGTDGPLLYERRNAFSKMSRFMTLFTYGVGTNGDLHSIRGHTSRIFNSVVADTRTINAFVDMAVFSATPHLECANEDAMMSIPMRKVGYMTVVGQGNKFMDVKIPNFEENLIPLHGMMTQLLEGESSGASLMPAQRGMERKTDRQEANERLAEGQLTTSAMALFFPALERLLKEVIRRVSRKNYRSDEPGGEEAWWLRNRLRARGVPLEALYEADIDAIEVNTGIGKGSQSARMAAANEIMNLSNALDEQGKNEALRIKIGTLAGIRKANLLAPAIPGQRPGQQVENAMLQNGFLCGGNPAQISTVKPLPDQNSAAHVQTHLQFLQELWPMTEQQDQRAALTAIQPVWNHCIDDWQMMDPGNPLYKEAKQALREMGEYVTNTAKELAAEEDRAHDEAARNGGDPNAADNGTNGKDVGGEGPSMSNFARAIDAKAKLSFTIQKNEEDLRHQKEMNSLKAAGMVQTMNLKNVEAKNRLLNQP